jgi:hypothetical protein
MNLTLKLFQIAIFKCCAAPLDKLDLTFLNLKFLTLHDLENHIKSVTGESAFTEYKTSYNEWTTKWHPNSLIALCSNNLDLPLKKGVFDEIQRALLILFPSDFRNYSMITFRVYEHNTTFGGEDQVWESPHRQRDMKQPLTFDSKNIPEIEDFLQLYFKKPIPNYLRLCIDSYVSHFYQWKKSLSYLSLSICMETIAEGKEMITYKIRRILSIINGRTKEESDAIFANIKHIYELRSKIVHGENYKESDLDVYLPYLKQLIACTIIELLVHGVDDRKDLDEKITALGFGQKNSLSNSYNSYLPDCFCHFNREELQKPSSK